jgi:D-alanyl-D-alanine carboxypeptidase (penicillin-binding protein 5/6)
MSYRRIWRRLVSILCVLLFCLTSTSAVSAASENPDAADIAAADTAASGAADTAASGAADTAADTAAANTGAADTAADTAAADAEVTAEPERLEPDAYFEPVQTDSVTGWPAGPAVWAESAVVMDLDSGALLYSKNMDVTKYPASITKIMTTLVAIENSSLRDRVHFSENAIYGIERDSSHIGMRVGEIISMEDCLYGMMLESANEVCLAVAEHVSGSVDGFVELMNQKAAELGCTNTHFTNPNGLPDENHYTTAHDMALIAQAAYANKTFRQVCRTETYCIPKTNVCGEQRWLCNHHKMLPNKDYTYDGCTGGKTGFTQAALNTLVTYAERNGRRLVCVSLRTNGRQIYTDTASMLDYGFNCFQNITIHSRSSNAGSTMLFPSICFGFPCTVDALRPTCRVTIPTTGTQEQMEISASLQENCISRTYFYGQWPVGNESVPTSAINTLLAVSSANTSGESDNTSLIHTAADNAAGAVSGITSSLKKLPVYVYLLAILLVVIILMETILLMKKRKRKKRRNQKSKK